MRRRRLSQHLSSHGGHTPRHLVAGATVLARALQVKVQDAGTVDDFVRMAMLSGNGRV